MLNKTAVFTASSLNSTSPSRLPCSFSLGGGPQIFSGPEVPVVGFIPVPPVSVPSITVHVPVPGPSVEMPRVPVPAVPRVPDLVPVVIPRVLAVVTSRPVLAPSVGSAVSVPARPVDLEIPPPPSFCEVKCPFVHAVSFLCSWPLCLPHPQSCLWW